MLHITDTQSYALVIRDVFFDALKSDEFFVNYTCRKTPANAVMPEQIPYLGVYLADETLTPDGDANQGPPKFIHTVKIIFSVLIAHNDQDAAEATIDAAWWRIMHRLLTDRKILNVYYSTNPDNTLIEAITRGSRRHVFGATDHKQQTPIAELRFEMQFTFRTYWPPIIPDDLREIDVTVVKPGEAYEDATKRPPVTAKYFFGPSNDPQINDLTEKDDDNG